MTARGCKTNLQATRTGFLATVGIAGPVIGSGVLLAHLTDDGSLWGFVSMCVAMLGVAVGAVLVMFAVCLPLASGIMQGFGSRYTAPEDAARELARQKRERTGGYGCGS